MMHVELEKGNTSFNDFLQVVVLNFWPEVLKWFLWNRWALICWNVSFVGEYDDKKVIPVSQNHGEIDYGNHWKQPSKLVHI